MSVGMESLTLPNSLPSELEDVKAACANNCCHTTGRLETMSPTHPLDHLTWRHANTTTLLRHDCTL